MPPPTDGELPKSYSPKDAEPKVRAKWDAVRAFHANPQADGDAFCIVIPPPNVTAALHLGHAFNNTLQDILTRFHRMKGDKTLWMPGTDHAGIATQAVVEKRLLLQDIKRRDLGREKFVEKVQAWKDEYEATIIEQLKLMGCSCDFDRTRFTMDEICAKAVREAFFRLFKDGLIYRGKRLVNWDPVSQTALADDEVEMEEIAGHMYYLRYPLIDTHGLQSVGVPGYVTVATTRPETMLGDTAVAINPKDPRAAKFVGRKIKLPIVDREIPIIADDYVVRPVQYGGDENDGKAKIATGFLKVTPAHDDNDYQIGQRHPEIGMINVFAPDASISDKHGWTDVSDEASKFIGLSREAARAKVVQWFKDHGLLEEVKPYTHSVGHSYRSHVPIEPYLSDQWYVKVTDDRLRGEALRAMARNQFEQPPSASAAGGTGVPPVHPKHLIGDSLDRKHRNLPHWQFGGSTYFITFRLRSGSLSETERRTVVKACLHWHEKRVRLHLATIMPDHVHLLLTPLQTESSTPKEPVWHSLSDLLHSIKSFTAHEIQRSRGSIGSLWQDESFDRIMRDDEEFLEKWNYIVNNSVKAGLVGSPDEYEFTIRPEDGTGGTPVPPATGDDALRFFPARYAKTFQLWHENIRDWCISRQIWWGHRIPVWAVRINPAKNTDQFGRPTQDEHASAIANELLGYLNACECEFSEIVIQQSANFLLDSTIFVCCRTIEADKALRLLQELLSHHSTSNSEQIRAAKKANDDLKASFGEKAFQKATGLRARVLLAGQDPDVLDTWFSSALWPISTMGWPDPNAFPNEIPEGEALIDTFNPSTVLFTAREIITLWVSRMVMFNRYFRDGKLPFENVYIHAMIQDGHGQKMSKSLGNGVDPRDIIHSHGADAMRFTLAKLATSTQDVRLPVDMICPHQGCEETFQPKEIVTSAGHRVADAIQTCPKCKKKIVSGFGAASGLATPGPDQPLARNSSRKFDEGRNFATKLWNATRFALTNLKSQSTSNDAHGLQSVGVDTLTLVDKWILSRLHRTLHAVEDALEGYQFNAYADAMYDFIWRDFCDWYLEAIKPTVKSNPAQQQVLATVLNASLRLLHPIMPFVTETIWPHACVFASDIEGIKLGASANLVTAPWPSIQCSVDDDAAVATFDRIQNLVNAIRQRRSEHKVVDSKLITLHAPPHVLDLINQAGGVVQALAKLKDVSATTTDRPAGGAAVSVPFEGAELLLSGLVDAVNIDAEKTRLGKLIAEKEKAVAGFTGRLSNEGYVSKAPPAQVEQTRQMLAQAEADLNAARQALASLGQ